MLLKSITLENFGAYRDKNTIKFNVVSPDKNVILIGGENGSGKTTLLKSIKVALFGPFAFGFKTINNQYINIIKSYLNKDSLKDNKQQFSISLTFTEVEDYKKVEYKFVRYWKLNNDNINEYLHVYKDSLLLNQAETEIYQQMLKEKMPPEIFDLCLFDGEEITKIINENLLSEHLFRLSKSLFNLNLFESLEQNLLTLESKKVSDHHNNEIENQIKELNEKIELTNKHLLSLKSQYQDNNLKISDYQSELNELIKDYEIHGGLYKEQRDNLISRLSEIDNIRKEINNKIKKYVGILLPFQINKNLLKETIEQLENENRQRIFSEFSSNLTNDITRKVLNDIGIKNYDDSLINNLKESLLKQLQPNNKYVFHYASNEQKNKLLQISELLEKELPDYYLNLIVKNQELLEEAKLIRKKINKHDQTNEFTFMIQKMEKLKFKIETLKNHNLELQEEIQKITQGIQEYNDKLKNLEKERFKNHKQKNALELIKNIVNTSKEFRLIQQRKKIQEVQSEATIMLKKLLRKENYITNVYIDPINYKIDIKNSNNDFLEINNLSAGEKQILLLSIIWAMFKVSGWRIPFIFDTLLGRLDKTHKTTILTELIPVSGEQTLILSTNTEIDENHFTIIKPYLSHVYTLEFDNYAHKVNINNGRFFEFGKEAIS